MCPEDKNILKQVYSLQIYVICVNWYCSFFSGQLNSDSIFKENVLLFNYCVCNSPRQNSPPVFMSFNWELLVLYKDWLIANRTDKRKQNPPRKIEVFSEISQRRSNIIYLQFKEKERKIQLSNGEKSQVKMLWYCTATAVSTSCKILLI